MRGLKQESQYEQRKEEESWFRFNRSVFLFHYPEPESIQLLSEDETQSLLQEDPESLACPTPANNNSGAAINQLKTGACCSRISSMMTPSIIQKQEQALKSEEIIKKLEQLRDKKKEEYEMAQELKITKRQAKFADAGSQFPGPSIIEKNQAKILRSKQRQEKRNVALEKQHLLVKPKHSGLMEAVKTLFGARDGKTLEVIDKSTLFVFYALIMVICLGVTIMLFLASQGINSSNSYIDALKSTQPAEPANLQLPLYQGSMAKNNQTLPNVEMIDGVQISKRKRSGVMPQMSKVQDQKQNNVDVKSVGKQIENDQVINKNLILDQVNSQGQ
ncbi:UNKNOWN [Stylonychia lemnae]|uniref:Uncharacterized protein n=1 Tax=Stylonychia lemnae TaxID=5949 RepID=A0A077ZRB3_STYLE|nr:UNKNOWN [Stylonychia lemnae]|eukprot:CDW71989.1 UNKNOWN [Stylonychia lemnae]